jgi:hypothetical protein
MGKTRAAKAHRAGVAARCPEPAVPKRMAVARALLGDEDPRRRALAVPLVKAARPPDAHPLSLLQPVPGIGPRLRRVRLDELHDRQRVPRGQDVGSSGRLGTWAQDAAGPRSGTAGAKLGQASRPWACAEAAVLVLRDHPAGHRDLPRVEPTHGQGNTVPLLAPQLGRAVSDR